MKKIKIIAILVLFLPIIFVFGCGQSLPEMNIERDNYLTGGKLSFSYDTQSRTAYFGDENEVIQFYEKDISKGFLKEGNRVGIKLVPSSMIEDLGSLSFKIGKEEFKGSDTCVKINDKLAYFQLFPIVNESGQIIVVNVEYKNQKAKYLIKIHEKTILMEKTA